MIIKFFLLLLIIKLISCLSNQKPEVWITLSSFSENEKENRLIELNWRNHLTKFNNLISIALTDKEPVLNSTSKNYLFFYSNLKSSNGYVRSNIQMPIIDLSFEKFSLKQECLFNIWIIYLFKFEPVVYNCLKTNPNWFENLYPYIKNKSLKQIVIAGTHDSGSYLLPIVSLGSIFYKKFILTQEENIFNQLIFGIRFFDLRISYERVLFRLERFWIVHGPIRMQISLDEVLQQIKKFLQLTKKEIIIIDFHKFEKGFKLISKEKKRKRHQQLINLILKYLHPYLAYNLNPYNEKIETLLDKNHRVIIAYLDDKFEDFNDPINNYELIPNQPIDNKYSYANNRYLYGNDRYSFNKYSFKNEKYSFLHKHVHHYWPNADNLIDFENYLNNTFNCDSSFNLQNKFYYDEIDNLSLHSLMAELTPIVQKIIFFKYQGGLRKMAQIVNHYIDDWILTRYHSCVNIIATDFFLGNNIIEIATRINQFRSFNNIF